MLNLESPITNINRIGAVTAKRLKLLGLETIKDLLFYFPYRYDDFSKATLIRDLTMGATVNIVGIIELIQNRRSPRKKMYITEALVSDESDQIKIIWFNQPFIAKNLKIGDKISLAGKVESDYGNFLLKSPSYEKISHDKAIHTAGLVPIYHLTANLTNKQIRFLIKQILPLADSLDDLIPKNIIKKQKLISLSQAVKNIHFPKNNDEIIQARKRLAFNELFLLQLKSQVLKMEIAKNKAEVIAFKTKETKKFVKNLPFILTNDQKKATWSIIQDLGKNTPMTRLLEGDVGSGKTVAAMIAMYNTALNNKQSVLMVPTEILAQQHFDSFCKFFKKTKTSIGLITGSKKDINLAENKKPKKINPEFIINNSKIIIGTHALIQKKINFNNLALIIIDEQHRFGVEQRKILTKKSSSSKKSMPHLLSMTATPIPRSLALALYGDLDVSIIKEMPKNRQKIKTFVVPENKRAGGYNFIRKEIKKGRQAFVVCPLIDISDKLGVKSVKTEYEKLNKKIFPNLKLAMLHGRLKQEEKNKIMKNFSKNKINILVSTSVIEVGIDIPNATIIMIEDADRFGLAQLHQFRGRVGRDKHESYCLLFTNNKSEKTIQRLTALTKYDNGFDLAKIDLKFRGPGEVYGTAQKGFPELKIATLFDYELTKKAQEEATYIIKKGIKNFPKIKEKLEKMNNIIHRE